MKKMFAIIIIFILFTILIFSSSSHKEYSSVFYENKNNDNHYKLLFNNENLTIRNFKLKLNLFVKENSFITKVYIDYKAGIKEYFIDKEYFSFDNSNINVGIETLKKEYESILRNNYLYNELELDINDVKIYRVDVYTDKDTIKKFSDKFPNVIIKYINKLY